MRLTADSPLPHGVMFARLVRPPPGRIAKPDVCCDLIWYEGQLQLTGPQSRAAPARSTAGPVQLMNIDPLLARAWLGVPLHELVDRRMPLDDISPTAAGRLSELFDAGRAEQLVRPADAPHGFLIDARARAAAAVLKAGGPVSQAAAAACLSERQLERLFQDRFGLRPKQYAAILRLRRAVKLARDGVGLAAAAAEAGYVDQPHFNRDVLRLSGRTPLALLPHVGNSQYITALTRDD